MKSDIIPADVKAIKAELKRLPCDHCTRGHDPADPFKRHTEPPVACRGLF